MKFFLFLLITFINLGCSHSLLDSKVEYKTPVQEGYERYFNKIKILWILLKEYGWNMLSGYCMVKIEK